MEKTFKSDKKVREKYKKRDGIGLLKLSQTLNIKKEKEKTKETNKEIEDKKEKIMENFEEKDSEKNKIIKDNAPKSNKSINYILSDSETTNGDTLNDYNKKRYIYRKAVTKKNCSFAINNIMQNKTQPITYEKKSRINNSMSLNKFIKNNDNIRNTNHNFYHKQSSLIEKYRTGFNNSKNLTLNKSINFYNLRNNNNSRNFTELSSNFSGFFYKTEKIINIEDLLILEEKFKELLTSVKLKHNTPNECFELMNSYQQSSLYNNFESFFKDNKSKEIVQISILYFIFNVIICYHFSFDIGFFSTCHQYLESILEINYKSYLLLCKLISLKISSLSKDNIWVDKLNKMLKTNLKHIELNNKEYIKFLMSQDNINYKNQNLNLLLEIKFYSFITNKYLQLFLNSINIENKFKNEFCYFFDNININNLSEDKLLYFFKSKIIRIINQNASVAGIESSSYGILLSENTVQVPYLKFPCSKKFSLVLDLDETLISFRTDPKEENKGTIRFRPYLDSFLQKVQEKYELIVFTSGTQDYADPLEDAIEQDRKYFDARLYRQHTITCGKDIVKDISRIGRSLDKIIIVENMPQNYRLQKENGILIKSFYGEDIYDNALSSLGDILVKIANEFNDVRIGISKYKNEILDKVSTNFSKNEF